MMVVETDEPTADGKIFVMFPLIRPENQTNKSYLTEQNK
jgi:hypothetical protein